MKSSPSVSSSDLERGRAIAERLVSATPGAAVAPVEKPADYVSFKAKGVATAAPPFRPAPPAAPTPPPRPASAMRPAPAPPAPAAPTPPEPPPFAAEPTRVEPPAPVRAAAPPVSPPVAPRAAARPAAAPPPPPPPPPPPAAPVNASVFEMDDGAGLAREDDGLGVLEDEPAEPLAPEAAVAEPSLEFDEDIADVAAAAVGAVEEPAAAAEPAPTWADILDDAIYLAHARCALVMDGAGQVHESRGDWPKNTLDKVAARLLRGIEQAPAPAGPDATQLIEIQLGSFFLTGLRAVLQGSPVVVGFLSQAPVKREARPGLETEIKRGTPLS